MSWRAHDGRSCRRREEARAAAEKNERQAARRCKFEAKKEKRGNGKSTRGRERERGRERGKVGESSRCRGVSARSDNQMTSIFSRALAVRGGFEGEIRAGRRGSGGEGGGKSSRSIAFLIDEPRFDLCPRRMDYRLLTENHKPAPLDPSSARSRGLDRRQTRGGIGYHGRGGQRGKEGAPKGEEMKKHESKQEKSESSM